MPKVSFRMASASRESVFGVQTNTARKIHRSDHTEGRLTTAQSRCCVRKGTPCGHSAYVRAPFAVTGRQRVLAPSEGPGALDRWRTRTMHVRGPSREPTLPLSGNGGPVVYG